MHVIRILDGAATCIVGFLPLYMHSHLLQLEGKYAQIIEIYNTSRNSAKKKHVQQWNGLLLTLR
jgi:hypothetical protein